MNLKWKMAFRTSDFEAPDKEQEEPLMSEKSKNQEIPALDLHGLTFAKAASVLERFILDQGSEVLKIRVIHGKGIHSPDKKSVLQTAIRERLSQWKKKNYLVKDFAYTPAQHGGTGATFVWLLPRKGR